MTVDILDKVLGELTMAKKKNVKKKSKTKLVSKPKTSIEELKDSRDGGQNALRGYSYQFLYSCYLLLSEGEEDVIFNLEGIEDIDYRICENDGQSITHIQLKYSTVKQDASFMPSVLKNFLEAYLIDKNRNFKLVYDFSVATGYLKKLLEGKLDLNSQKYWKAVIEKIKKENSNWNWNNYGFEEFISKISYENVKKSTLEDDVEKTLINNYGITTGNIKLYANSMEIFCLDKMESRSEISLGDIKKCIEEVKFDISMGPQNPAHSWIKKIDFITSLNSESDYYEGKKATPLDIANGLPVSRPIIEKELTNSVNDYMVTIIKSSSGQGKTTLALKTQYVLKEEYTPYQIICCNNRKELGHIVEYFHSRIRLGEKPLILLDNLDAHLSEWNQLVQLMQSDVAYNYKFLVTSRENDWYNYGGDISNIHSMNIIKPILSKEEAIEIFNTLQKSGHIHSKIMDWKNSWEKIAEKKLLIEYVYLLTHGEMIAERISAQMSEIGTTAESGIKFEILRTVCFADICGIKLLTRKLLQDLSRKSSYDVGEILKSMVDEFLVHVSKDGDYVEGLHPVRSQHIVNRLHEYYPFEETAYNVTKLADIKDFAILFSHYPEFEFDKEKFYSDIVQQWWNLEDLKCFVFAIRGTFSGSVMQYFKQNEEVFNDANDHNGLYVLATDICPFAQFQEIDESLQTLEKMKELMPDNQNIQYLLRLRDTITRIDIVQTDIYILSSKLYNKLKEINTKDIADIDSYALISDWLYNMDISLNLATNINLENLWIRAEKCSIDTVSLLMYTSYCGNREVYKRFITENLEIILKYLKHKTFSHRIFVAENTIHVEYVLRSSEIQKGNEESVSRLKYICRTLPVYEKYYSDAIMPRLDILEGYTIPDDAHKEMPRRNLVIMFHQEFTSLWIKTIQSNYEFDSVSEWIEHWFNIRQCICESLDKLCICIYKLLAGKKIGSTGVEFDKKREKFESMICGVLSYPKEYRPFEKVIDVPKKFTKIRQEYFNSIQNFLRQVVGLIKKNEKDSRLVLFNLKQATASLSRMHEFFENMALEDEYITKHLRLCEYESQKIIETDMCCRYYLQHNAVLNFNKYQVKSWYMDICKKEISEVNVVFESMQHEYDAVFPTRVYEDEIFKSYPIILKAFDLTNEEMMQNFIVNSVAFAESSFDYLIVLICNDENYILPMALKFPKRFFETVHEILISGDQNVKNSFMTPYPVDVTPEMMKCFDYDMELQPQNINPYIHNIGDIGEELWVYSKIRELLHDEEDKIYCAYELKKVMDKIDIMQKEVQDHLDLEIANQMNELCSAVYSGDLFDDVQLNEFIQRVQLMYS